ncbi:transcriptional activator of ethanol catabolism AlcS [Cordyceps militaris CM01]|uniref:Transcriptional activator of ethanol catabolism AlcS n=1 Tax=Cordyceps militaris (strain CM01) TaxID=983644 RepID=G3JQA8_CORMM|nr:transcriptional activator of ethanol catabolism AlcS [Cordyceps militaris CM01]EGX89359.1 transcriptional activator of ethanol catabolism AlcS [Cordyceps militaris CM01]
MSSYDTKGSDSASTQHDISSLQPIQSVTITTEMFEKLYLNPASRVQGHLRQTFANPTPLPLVGFLIASAPLGCALMGWRGAGGGGAATIGTFYFFGGALQLIGAILEWILGNTFVYIVFGSFGAFWLAFAITLTPFYNAEGAFTANATTAAEKAAGEASYQASLAFFLLFMGILVFMYLICALRTNVVFFAIFFFLDISLFLLAGAYWKGATGDMQAFHKLQVATGAFVFVFCVFGWYLLFVQLLRSVDFPLDLPVGDLSRRLFVRRQKAPEDRELAV